MARVHTGFGESKLHDDTHRDFFDQAVANEYARWHEKVGEHDPYASENTVGIHEVLRAHFLIVDHFMHHANLEGIGGIGPRDVDMLHSALHRQFSGYGGVDKWNTNYELIATVFFGLIKGHPFFDANRRTAFLTLLLHLQKVKLGPTMRQRDLENLAVCVAENGLSKYPRYARFEVDSDDPEVNFLAHYLRKNTRRVDKQYPDYVRTSCSRLHTGAGTGFGPLTWRRAAHSDRFGGRCTFPTARSMRSIEQDELRT